MSENQPATQIPLSRFRPLKTHFFIVAFILVLCVIAMGFDWWFSFTLIVPAIYVLWILRVRTEVDSRGIRAVYLLKGTNFVAWQDFQGILFNKAGKGYAVDKKDRRFVLPAITFNSLPDLNRATKGRIPDPVTPARAAEDAKVEVFHRDGYSVMKTRDEIEREARESGSNPSDPEARS